MTKTDETERNSKDFNSRLNIDRDCFKGFNTEFQRSTENCRRQNRFAPETSIMMFAIVDIEYVRDAKNGYLLKGSRAAVLLYLGRERRWEGSWL